MKRLILGFILGLATLPAATSATGLWVGSTTITSPFYTASLHHLGCGPHTSGITRGYYGAYHQRFRHCSMTFSRVYVTHFPTSTPLPEQGIIGGILGGTPTATPRPTSTPLPTIRATPTTLPAPPVPSVSPVSASAPPTRTPLPPTLLPTATATAPPVIVPPVGDAASYELSLMNTTRAQYGLPPYSINPTESAGTATCVGSYGHSVHMAAMGAISHDQFPADICVPVRSAGENVGMAGGYSVTGSLDVIHQSMMAEPHDPTTCATGSNHACSIISPTFTQVGIGVYTAGGATWLTVDFTG